MMPKAIDTAKFFLQLAAEEPETELMTHLRLQKLLYYAQGLSLAYRDRPVFDDEIEAWTWGPVVAAVHSEFKPFGADPIPYDESVSNRMNEEDQDFVRTVWESYRGYSAIGLKDMTHSEAPWQGARKGLEPRERSNEEITRESLKRFFDDMCAREMQRCSGITKDQMKRGEEDARNGKVKPWKTIRGRLVQCS